MTAKVIETEYNGYKFRSRLEARWAVAFDALGIEYEYEPEGFDLGDGVCYLPDFLLHNINGRHRGNGPSDVWVEVKGNMKEEDKEKISRFAGWKELSDFEKATKDKDGIKGYFPQLDKEYKRIMTTYPSVYVVGDIPNPNKRRDYENCVEVMLDIGCDSDLFSCATIDGDQFGLALCIDVDGLAWLEDANYNMEVDIDNEATDAAYKAARQARFEHGETPDPEDLRTL